MNCCKDFCSPIEHHRNDYCEMKWFSQIGYIYMIRLITETMYEELIPLKGHSLLLPSITKGDGRREYFKEGGHKF